MPLRATVLLTLLLACGTSAVKLEATKPTPAEIEKQFTVHDASSDKTYWSPPCPVGFEKQWSAQNVASVCFYVGQQRYSWGSARNACRQLASNSNGRCHGDLASILNSGESNYVRNMMSMAQLSDHAWIGLNDLYQEGRMEWSDGRSATFSNFYYGEPNDGAGAGEDCVEMLSGYNGQWNDRNCYDLKHFVCKAYCV